jgi:hypothetical protein
MSEAVVQKGEGSLRAPSNLREVIALALALVIVLAIIQLGAPIVRELTFIDEKIRDSVIGLAFFAFPAINRTIKQLLDRSSGAGLVRPDLSPWFVTGIFAATLMFAWNQFVTFLASVSIFGVVGTLAPPEAMANNPEVMILAISLISLPMTFIAAIVGGILLNRYTRTGILFALLLAVFALVSLNITISWLTTRDVIERSLQQAGGIGGLLIGFAAVALIIFAGLGIGVLISRINRERSIGRLLSAARKLSPTDRDEVTADVLARLEKKA